jgi:CubicO group peptidase (beta-lactamase class C family)
MWVTSHPISAAATRKRPSCCRTRFIAFHDLKGHISMTMPKTSNVIRFGIITGPEIVKLSLAVLVCFIGVVSTTRAADERAETEMTSALVPSLEAYIRQGMQTFDCPGLAIGIVADDRLVYGKGFGVRNKSAALPVDPRTLFQIGSTTKAFLAATIALMVDRGKLRWDDRIVDLYPEFQLQDPWVTREFRVFDLLAQRSGLPPEVNDGLSLFGYPESDLIRSLRFVAPVSSFRSTFSYTNITHVLAGRIVAKAAGAADWNAVLQKELLDPLGMSETSYTAAAMQSSSDHATGYRWTPQGTIEVPFTQIFPYDFFGAGDINSSVENMAHWVRLQLGKGRFEDRRLVSELNLELTHQPRIAINNQISYASGWVDQATENGNIIWHNGGTSSFGAYVGLSPAKHLGVIVLTNEVNVGFPDAIGLWTLDRILGNPEVDHVAAKHHAAIASFDAQAKQFVRPTEPQQALPAQIFRGSFVNGAFGKVTITSDDETPVMIFQTTGAALRLDSWDGGVRTATYLPAGRFAAMAEALGPSPVGFVQLQMDKDGRPNMLRLTFSDGQSYEFTREPAP